MDYKEVLKSVDYPIEILCLDFETYFDTEYSLRKMSTIEFINDDKFDFTGCGFAILNSHYEEDEFFITKSGLKFYIKELQEVSGKNFEKFTIVVQNARFDITILNEKFGINPPYVIDVKDLACHYDARMPHDLDSLAKLFKLQAKGDTSQFKGLHYEDMTEEQQQVLAEYCENDLDLEVKLFKILLPLLSNPEMELALARHTLGLYLNPRLQVDYKLADELKAAMDEKIYDVLRETGLTKKQINSNITFAGLLMDALPEEEEIPVKVGKPTKNMIKLFDERCNKQVDYRKLIPALAKDDIGFQQLLVHPDENVRQLVEARQAIKSWPTHVKRINNIVNQAKAAGDYLKVPLNYYGGHTGRWSGGEKINLQNLGGRGRAGQGTHPLIQRMRNLLIAPDEYTLLIADSAQIETRILAWLAGQMDLLEGFARGEDIYSEFATELFNCYIRKPRNNDPKILYEFLKVRRGFGKDTVLGCGFGLGSNRFYENCMKNKNLRPFFDSGEYTWDFINKLIKTYRTKYSKIPEFWSTVEKAFKWVIKYPHEKIFYPTIKGEGITDLTLLTFWKSGGTVYLQLPSGRTLSYRHASIDKEKTIRWHYGHLWGGSITENIVQSVARDLLGVWILRCEKMGLPVALTCHDEIISVVREKDAELKLQQMINVMCFQPDWAIGLPLGAAGDISKEYKV